MSQARLFRSALLVAFVAMTAMVAGCARPHHEARRPQERTVFVERDRSNGTTIRIRVGDQVALILSSTYWNVRGSAAPTVLRQDGPAKLLGSPSSCPPGVGCGSLRTFFTALTPGTAMITAHRDSCGEALRCVGSRGRFRLTVIVTQT